jgi:hypothetical protein
VKAMEEQKRMTDRFASTLVIAASIIAAVRLAREQDISRRHRRRCQLHVRKSEPFAANSRPAPAAKN